MNIRVLDWLFDLGPIPTDTTGVELAWARPMSGWVWLLAVVVVIALSVWSYSKLQGPQFIRFILAGLRTCTIMLVIILIAGPQIRFPREEVEQDVVLAMLDRSSSMSIRDAQDGSVRITREEQLTRMLEQSESTWETIDNRSELRWLGFSAGSFNLAREEPEAVNENEEEPAPVVMPHLEDPDGWRTDISASLQQAIDGAIARPISGVVLFSDGRR